MARKNKVGLDYFPLDTLMEDNVELIESRHGLVGFAVLIKIYQKIYRENGYYMEWGSREQLLTSRRINVDINTLNVIINDCIEYGLFDKSLASKGILTSRGIQKRFVEACSRRNTITLCSDLLLINVDINHENDSRNKQVIVLNVYFGTQRKGKEIERKGDYAEINDDIIPDFEDDDQIFQQPTETKKQKQVYSPNNALSRIESLRQFWVSLSLPGGNQIIVNGQPKDNCMAGVSSEPDDEKIKKSMQNYAQIIHNPDKYEFDLKFQYQSFHAFMLKGISLYSDEMKPLEARLKKDARQPIVHKKEICPKCGAEVKYGVCTECEAIIGPDGKEVTYDVR